MKKQYIPVRQCRKNIPEKKPVMALRHRILPDGTLSLVSMKEEEIEMEAAKEVDVSQNRFVGITE